VKLDKLITELKLELDKRNPNIAGVMLGYPDEAWELMQTFFCRTGIQIFQYNKPDMKEKLDVCLDSWKRRREASR